MNEYTTDVAIIGFGKAGKTLAGALAKKGNTVTVIEKSAKMYGGTCIYVGCLPTKSLTHSAKLLINYQNLALSEILRLTTSFSNKPWTIKLN